MLYVNNQGFSEYKLIERSNGRNTFSFQCPLEFRQKLNLYDTVQIQGQKYVIDEFNSDGETLEVVGTTDLISLKGLEVGAFEGTYTLEALLLTCRLKAKGYKDKAISIKFDGGTAYDLFKKIGENEHIGLKQLSSDTFYCYDFIAGKTRPASILAHKRLNVLSLNYKEDVLEHFNEVICYGKDGIKAVASTGETPKLIKVVRDERFSVRTNLQAFADSLLRDHKEPIKSYEIELADLSKHSTIHKKVELFDNVSYLGELSTGETYTVWEIERSPLGDRVKLANRRLTFASLFEKYEEKAREEADKVSHQVKDMGLKTNEKFNQVNNSIRNVDFRINSVSASVTSVNGVLTETKEELKTAKETLQTRVTQTEEKIKLEASRISSNEKKVASLTLTANSITSRVIQVENETTKIATLETNVNRISASVQEIEPTKKKVAELIVQANGIFSRLTDIENKDRGYSTRFSEIEQTYKSFSISFANFSRTVNEKLKVFVATANGIIVTNLRVNGSASIGGNLETQTLRVNNKQNSSY